MVLPGLASELLFKVPRAFRAVGSTAERRRVDAGSTPGECRVYGIVDAV
jgi:hypothetical protein